MSTTSTQEHRLLENAQIAMSGPVAWSGITLVQNALQVEAENDKDDHHDGSPDSRTLAENPFE